MKKIKRIITSESVSSGHPDKICDQISDKILDYCLIEDPNSRVACEVMACNRLIIIGGEITTKAKIDLVKLAWDVLLKIGYNKNDFTIISNINKQSSDLNKIVTDKSTDVTAGDQGIVYGYACDDTPQFMPLPIVLAHELLRGVEELKKTDETFKKILKNDMKSQVSIDYSEDKPRISKIIMSCQHPKNINLQNVEWTRYIKANLMDLVAKKYGLNTDFEYQINPGGCFVIGGPIGDTGLTGRKIIVDTYGGAAHHGGGAFSGKDCSKVDRSGAYLARYIAKNIVFNKLASKCEIQLSYCIGELKPYNIYIDTFGTNIKDMDYIYEMVEKYFNLNLNSVIDKFALRSPIYSQLSTFGHFGHSEDYLGWEHTFLFNKEGNNLNE